MTSAYMGKRDTYIPWFEELAAQDRFGVHALASGPESADVILFVDAHMHPGDIGLNAIRRHPVATGHCEKTYLYSEQDQPWCAMPGLYVSMPAKNFNPARQRSCAYVRLRNPHVLTIHRQAIAPDLLFSFLGRRGPAIREAVMALSHPRSLIEDTSAVNFFYSHTDETERRERRYAEIIGRSKFVLCPRGDGVSSFRLFETMAAARVPVIISDQWVPPAGPDWSRCSLRVPERDIASIPAILERREGEFEVMGYGARREWVEWFAPDVLFHRMVELCLDLRRQRMLSGVFKSDLLDARYLWLRGREAKWRIKTALSRAVGCLSAQPVKASVS